MSQVTDSPRDSTTIASTGGVKGKEHRRPSYGVIFLTVLAVVLVWVSWGHMTTQLALAASKGVYTSAEEGMREMLAPHYVGLSSIDIMSAGPNSHSGRQPWVWYVIAEVRAERRADGGELKGGCAAPGTFFLQTKVGWVNVPEGAFPGWIGFWMKVFGRAGEGQSESSTVLSGPRPVHFCEGILY